MGKTLRNPEWGRVLGIVAGAGILFGSGIVAFAGLQTFEDQRGPAESTPPSPANTLVGEQALAFHSGYIHQHIEQVSGKVIRARESKQYYSRGEILYLKLGQNADAKVGDLLTLYRPSGQVYHPITRENMGKLIVILGVLEVAKEPREGVTEALIVRSFDSLATGDLVMPFKIPPQVPDQQVTSGPVTGVIVEFKEQRQVTGQTEIVYIDRGEMDGVALGDRFSVAQRGFRQSLTTRNPDQAIGKIKIVSLQARTATAHVLQSTDVIRRGDIINRLPPPPPKAEPAAAPPKEAAADTMAVAKTTPPEAPPTPAGRELTEVHFAFDKWQLSDEDKKTLTEHAAYLKENPTLTITVEGHADERGSAEYNRSLGEKRAEEVRRFLADAGTKNALTVASYGKDRPACTEQNETCFAKNRRVHLSVGN
jgi:peptidoglycan-associated lipoprotein